jgi:ParB family chromosome partitioning protein
LSAPSYTDDAYFQARTRRAAPKQQEQALAACYQEQYGNASKSKRILLPVRNLQQWIEHNILLELASAPFSKQDAQLVPEAGSCMDCPKRTGHNTLLFEGMATRHDFYLRRTAIR